MANLNETLTKKASYSCVEANLADMTAEYLLAMSHIELLKNQLKAYEASVLRHERVLSDICSDPVIRTVVIKANKHHKPSEPIKPYI